MTRAVRAYVVSSIVFYVFALAMFACAILLGISIYTAIAFGATTAVWVVRLVVGQYIPKGYTFPKWFNHARTVYYITFLVIVTLLLLHEYGVL